MKATLLLVNTTLFLTKPDSPVPLVPVPLAPCPLSLFMFFTQIYEPGLAHASYMVGCKATGQCAVIDAKRDVDTYIEIARKEGLKITHLLETHIHADFLSGTRELAELTRAEMYLSDEGGNEWQYEFPHEGLRHNDALMIGNIRFQVIHTPGHTPEHISFLVTDTPAIADVPIMIFSGDFVFVGDVGRPDLLEKAAGYKGTMEPGARQLWESLKIFKELPDFVQVHPAHGAGSACGKALGSVPSSTVGYEKLVNWALKHTNEEEFVHDLLSGQPEPPKYFAQMKRLNKVPRELLTTVPKVQRLTVDDVRVALENKQCVVDARPKSAFAIGHIPGTISIPNNKSFSTWAGWLISYDKPFIIIISDEKVNDVMRRLMRIGLDHIQGYYPNVTDLEASICPLQTFRQVDIDDLEQVVGNDDVVVIDVRSAVDFEKGHIPRAWNIHTGYLTDRLGEIPYDKRVVLSCDSGDRSSIGTSILECEGFTNVENFSPGFTGWYQANKPVELNGTSP